jgi:hypothetical protein
LDYLTFAFLYPNGDVGDADEDYDWKDCFHLKEPDDDDAAAGGDNCPVFGRIYGMF